MTTQSITIMENNASTAFAHVALGEGAAGLIGHLPGGMPAFIPEGQVYYWTYAWQDAERKGMEDLRAGRTRSFDDPLSAVRYLLGSNG